jgi:hypothetical protein
MEFLGRSGASDDRSALEDRDFEACGGALGRNDEPVVAAPDVVDVALAHGRRRTMSAPRRAAGARRPVALARLAFRGLLSDRRRAAGIGAREPTREAAMSGLTLTKDVLTDFGYTITSAEIDLSNQNIGDIDIDAFEEYEEVTKVNLSGNQIEFVDRGTFAANAKLVELALANNKLHAFSAEVFGPGSVVESLDLSGNPLETLDVSLTQTLCLQSLKLDNTGVASRVQLKRVGRCLQASWSVEDVPAPTP